MERFEQIARPRHHFGLAGLLVMLLVSGCASTPKAEFQARLPEGALARPRWIGVYDFAGTREELPADSKIAAYLAQIQEVQSPDERDRGRELGGEVGRQLVSWLNDAGIEVLQASQAGEPRVGDVLIRGEFVVVEPGSRTLRVLVGCGTRRREINSLVEAFEMTPEGKRALASAQTRTAGGRLPGLLVRQGVAGAIGSVATSAAVSNKSNVLQEMGPESMNAAAKRTVDGRPSSSSTSTAIAAG